MSIVKLLKTVEFTIKNVVVTEVTIRFVLNKGIVKPFEKEEGLKGRKDVGIWKTNFGNWERELRKVPLERNATIRFERFR